MIGKASRRHFLQNSFDIELIGSRSWMLTEQRQRNRPIFEFDKTEQRGLPASPAQSSSLRQRFHERIQQNTADTR